MRGEVWTPEIVEYAKQRWQGFDAVASDIVNDIGKRWGVTISRNALLGKMSRLGLACGHPRPKTEGARKGGIASGVSKRDSHPWRWKLDKRRTEPKYKAQGEVPAAPQADAPVPKHITIMGLRPEHCRWPYGNGPFTFCGHEHVPERPYCSYHTRIGYHR